MCWLGIWCLNTLLLGICVSCLWLDLVFEVWVFVCLFILVGLIVMLLIACFVVRFDFVVLCFMLGGWLVVADYALCGIWNAIDLWLVLGLIGCLWGLIDCLFSITFVFCVVNYYCVLLYIITLGIFGIDFFVADCLLWLVGLAWVLFLLALYNLCLLCGFELYVIYFVLIYVWAFRCFVLLYSNGCSILSFIMRHVILYYFWFVVVCLISWLYLLRCFSVYNCYFGAWFSVVGFDYIVRLCWFIWDFELLCFFLFAWLFIVWIGCLMALWVGCCLCLFAWLLCLLFILIGLIWLLGT